MQNVLRLLPVLLVLAALPAPAEAAELDLSFGGGFYNPFDDGHGDDYGSSPSFSAGVLVPMPPGPGFFFLETGWIHANGNDLGTVDPTFETDEATYNAFPVTIGAGVTGGAPESPVRIAFSIGWQTLFAKRTSSFDVESSATAHGIALDFRPRVRVNDRMYAWIRQRLTILSESDFDDRSLDFDGAQTEIGIALPLGGGQS
ncbi:MAG: hypothetical protein HKN20_06105 [Gemmatimonadetes bacterium]|nr:hypothetical protein [Gemmatimonadota bacterium]